jgi:methylmalonyl-CoA/ethylmalonyl-CoA epimerase
MLNFVHHVHYVVWNRDEMVAYLEKSFGMKPTDLIDDKDRGMKEALYQVGQTQIQIIEPTQPGTVHAQFLEKNGPCVHHVAWGVDNIHQKAQELPEKGITLRDEGGASYTPHGYDAFFIDPKLSQGILFQLAETPDK